MKELLSSNKFYNALTSKPIWTLFLVTFFVNCVASINNIIFLTPQDLDRQFVQRSFEALFLNFIFCVFIFYIFYLTKKLFKPLAYFIVIVSIFAFLLENFLVDKFLSFFTIQIFESILSTNFNEATEFAQSFIDFKIIVVALITFFVIFLISKIKPLKENKIAIYIINFIVLFSFIAIIATVINYTFITQKTSIARATRYPTAKLFLVPFQFFSKTGLGKTRSFIEHFKKLQEEEKNLTAKNGIDNIVLIIGESNARKYTGLYNPKYNTTPRIAAMENKIVFTDAVPVASSTPENLRQITTFRKNPIWRENLNLISLFKNSGYKTHWISNQESNGIYTNGSFSASELSDESFYTNKFTQNFDYKGSKFDGELIKVGQKFADKTDKGFFVFHFVGSHFTYSKRYPKEFAKFKPSDIKENINKGQKTTKAHYLNSVFYTDFVITEIYKIFKDKDALIIYLSDHGESLWDFQEKTGHGFACKATTEIPLVFMPTPKFIKNHEEIYKKLEQSRNLPFYTPNMPDLLCDIAGINSKWCNAKRSIINENYDTNFTRFVDGIFDYKTLK